MKKRKIETSKAVLVVVLVVSFIFASVVLVGWLVFDRSDASSLMGVILAPVATVIGFYTWKSRKENEIKLKKIYGDLYNPKDESEDDYRV